jgi:hypothetical protein
VCLTTSESSYIVGVTWPQLSAQFPGCAAPTDSGTPGCAAAVSRYCASRGFLTGFGPVEYGTADAQVVCVRRF